MIVPCFMILLAIVANVAAATSTSTFLLSTFQTFVNQNPLEFRYAVRPRTSITPSLTGTVQSENNPGAQTTVSPYPSHRLLRAFVNTGSDTIRFYSEINLQSLWMGINFTDFRFQFFQTTPENRTLATNDAVEIEDTPFVRLVAHYAGGGSVLPTIIDCKTKIIIADGERIKKLYIYKPSIPDDLTGSGRILDIFLVFNHPRALPSNSPAKIHLFRIKFLTAPQPFRFLFRYEPLIPWGKEYTRKEGIDLLHRVARGFSKLHEYPTPDDLWGSIRYKEIQRPYQRDRLFTDKLECPICLQNLNPSDLIENDNRGGARGRGAAGFCWVTAEANL